MEQSNDERNKEDIFEKVYEECLTSALHTIVKLMKEKDLIKDTPLAP